MKVDWITCYTLIAQHVHDIMVMPILKQLLNNNTSEYALNEFNRKLKYEAWYYIESSGKTQLDVYKAMYNKYGLQNKFDDKVEICKVVVLHAIQKPTRIYLEQIEKMKKRC